MLSIFETLGLPELAVILGVLLVVFGSKRLPEIARSIGRSRREFKRGLAEGRGDEPAANGAGPRA
jgi:sec-independent protein translocase protein TatA